MDGWIDGWIWWDTCEHKAASSWNVPPTNMQYSGVVILQWPRIPMQHGWPITSQIICSAAWPCPLCSKVSTSILRLHIGHLVISSGHTYGATEAGDSQNLEWKRKIKLHFANPDSKLHNANFRNVIAKMLWMDIVAIFIKAFIVLEQFSWLGLKFLSETFGWEEKIITILIVVTWLTEDLGHILVQNSGDVQLDTVSTTLLDATVMRVDRKCLIHISITRCPHIPVLPNDNFLFCSNRKRFYCWW